VLSAVVSVVTMLEACKFLCALRLLCLYVFRWNEIIVFVDVSKIDKQSVGVAMIRYADRLYSLAVVIFERDARIDAELVTFHSEP
jgi:hypothetical protein